MVCKKVQLKRSEVRSDMRNVTTDRYSSASFRFGRIALEQNLNKVNCKIDFSLFGLCMLITGIGNGNETETKLGAGTRNG